MTHNTTQLKHDVRPEAGFTIVELLIATTVFSMVLMVLLYGVLSFTHAYYSGINASTTQDTARTIINSVAQSIEFSGSSILTSVSGNTYYFCTGGNTYYFILGSMYDGATPTSGDPGLFVQPGTCTSSPNFSATGSKEMLEANMRITYFQLAQPSVSSRLYNVSIGLAYGDSDLLCNNSKDGSPGGCIGGTLNTQGISVIGSNADDVVCKQTSGSEFCAHAGLSTTVSLRVANGALAP